MIWENIKKKSWKSTKGINGSRQAPGTTGAALAAVTLAILCLRPWQRRQRQHLFSRSLHSSDIINNTLCGVIHLLGHVQVKQWSEAGGGPGGVGLKADMFGGPHFKKKIQNYTQNIFNEKTNCNGFQNVKVYNTNLRRMNGSISLSDHLSSKFCLHFLNLLDLL